MNNRKDVPRVSRGSNNGHSGVRWARMYRAWVGAATTATVGQQQRPQWCEVGKDVPRVGRGSNNGHSGVRWAGSNIKNSHWDTSRCPPARFVPFGPALPLASVHTADVCASPHQGSLCVPTPGPLRVPTPRASARPHTRAGPHLEPNPGSTWPQSSKQGSTWRLQLPRSSKELLGKFLTNSPLAKGVLHRAAMRKCPEMTIGSGGSLLSCGKHPHYGTRSRDDVGTGLLSDCLEFLHCTAGASAGGAPPVRYLGILLLLAEPARSSNGPHIWANRAPNGIDDVGAAAQIGFSGVQACPGRAGSAAGSQRSRVPTGSAARKGTWPPRHRAPLRGGPCDHSGRALVMSCGLEPYALPPCALKSTALRLRVYCSWR
eukprot:366110-Chlamydomonas_euryale.AAC.7